MWKSRLFLLLLDFLLPFLLAAPLQPGQPGAPWTEEEVEVTREKVKTKNASIPKISNPPQPPGAGNVGL